MTNLRATSIYSTSIGLLFILLSSCGFYKPTSKGGSVVGNGMIRYYSISYGYSFTYEKSLNFIEESTEKILVDDGTQNTEEVSRVRFQIFPQEFVSSKDLKKHAKARNSEIHWKETDLNGVAGFIATESVGQALETIYVLRLNEESILEIQLTENRLSPSVEALKEVLRSFSYDRDPPKILEAAFVPEQIEAGKKVQFRVRVIDEFSGINPTKPWFLNEFGRLDRCAKLRKIPAAGENHDDPGLKICGEFKVIGNDWYALDISVNKFLPNGEYQISEFIVLDNAGNANPVKREFLYYSNKSTYKSFFEHELLIPKLTVTNSGNSDQKSPKFTKVIVEGGEVVTGKMANILIETSDQESGLDSVCLSLKRGRKKEKGIVMGFGGYWLKDCSELESLGGNLHVARINIPEHMPSGEYSGGITVLDKVGNSSLKHFDLVIVNGGAEDFLEPVVHDLRLVDERVKIGAIATLQIRMTDNLSASLGTVHPVKGAVCNTFEGLSTWRYSSCGSPPRHVESDLWEMDFEIGSYAAPGRYRLSEFYVFDAVGNYTRIEAFKGLYQSLEGLSTKIPEVWLTVEP